MIYHITIIDKATVMRKTRAGVDTHFEGRELFTALLEILKVSQQRIQRECVEIDSAVCTDHTGVMGLQPREEANHCAFVRAACGQ